MIDKIPDGQKHGLSLASTWCDHHGAEFCDQILAGATHRTDISNAAREAREALTRSTEQSAAAEERRAERAVRFDELKKFRAAQQ